MEKKNFADTNLPDDLPRSSGEAPKKYYKVINTDLYRNKKVIPEGSIVDFFEPAFAPYLVPVDDAEEPLNVHPNPETVATKTGRGRPRKNN